VELNQEISEQCYFFHIYTKYKILNFSSTLAQIFSPKQ